MKTKLANILQRLSPRERALGGIALVLILILGASYGLVMPGISAARSAADRNTTAAKELTTAHSLAAALKNAPAAPATNVAALRQSAQASEITVMDVGSNQGATAIRVKGRGPAAILAWIAKSAEFGTMQSAIIEPDASGGAVATILFAGLTQ